MDQEEPCQPGLPAPPQPLSSGSGDLQGLPGRDATTSHVTQCFLGAGLRSWPRHLLANAHPGQYCQAIEAAPQCVCGGFPLGPHPQWEPGGLLL